MISGIPGKITIGGIPDAIIVFNSDKDELIILHFRPCLSADSIPSIKMLPLEFRYCLADSIASDIGSVIFQYFETTFIGKGKQIFSSSTKGSKS